jgi:cell wall-associated NlpC family hydrolase
MTPVVLRFSLRRSIAAFAFGAGIAVGPNVACAQASVPSSLTDASRPFAPFSASAQKLRDSIVEIARAQLGARYRRGGQSPERGFDCSGLVKYVMTLFKVEVPRTARQQAAAGMSIERDTTHLLPGDLLTFGKSKRGSVSHVGIYIGNGRYVHASSVAGRVIESPIDRSQTPLVRIWRGARRLLALDDAATIAKARGED